MARRDVLTFKFDTPEQAHSLISVRPVCDSQAIESRTLTTINSSKFVLSSDLNPAFANTYSFSTQHNESASRFLKTNPYLPSYLTNQLLQTTKQYR